jgi:hypothetical protein
MNGKNLITSTRCGPFEIETSQFASVGLKKRGNRSKRCSTKMEKAAVDD